MKTLLELSKCISDNAKQEMMNHKLNAIKRFTYGDYYFKSFLVTFKGDRLVMVQINKRTENGYTHERNVYFRLHNIPTKEEILSTVFPLWDCVPYEGPLDLSPAYSGEYTIYYTCR